MKKIYTIKVNDDYDYSFDTAVSKNLDTIQLTENQFHIVQDNNSFKIEIIKSDFQKKVYQISVNGNNYSVKIKDELDQLIKELGLTINGKQKDSNVKAPMPGIILDIQVVKEQKVVEGDALMVLEAMKMENILTAPKDGIIKSINVEKGVTVEKGELLIEME